MQTLVIASGNQGKIREIRAALQDCPLALKTQAEFSVPAAAEPYPTFLENALAKARQACRLTGLPALADDSGIVVAALDNAPGVRSARYAGDEANDEMNNAKLLAAMEGARDRRAYYYACIVALRREDDPTPLVAEGLWHGDIAAAPQGDNGFGYDPIFFDPTVGKTGGEMSIAEKQKVSHRGQSLARLLELMRRHRFF